MTQQLSSPASRTVGVEPAVRLIAPLKLVAQAIDIALRSRGWHTVVDASGAKVHAEPSQLLLIVDDMKSSKEVDSLRQLISASGCPALVLTARERDLYWGAVLAAGAVGVLHATASLDAVEAAIRGGWHGLDLTESEERARMIREWEHFLHEQDEFSVRMSLLSSQERAVLTGLCGGVAVAGLALDLGVAEATIRSQVRSILRKLGVRSQLAAVALVRRLECPA